MNKRLDEKIQEYIVKKCQAFDKELIEIVKN